MKLNPLPMVIYVAVGELGTIKTSTSGEEWASVDNKQYYSINSIVWGEAKFVAVGSDVILFSLDGKVRNKMSFKRSVATNFEFKDITWNGLRFVAVGNDGLIASSLDGVNWSDNSIFDKTHYYQTNFTHIITNGSKFIASGDGDMLYESDNGIDWCSNIPDAGYNNYRNSCYNGDVFIL